MNIADRVKELTRPTGEEDLLAVRYPKPRLKIEPRHAAWLGALCFAGIVVFVLLSRPPSTAHPAAPNPYAVLSSTKPAPEVVVSVVGAVERPQVLTLAPSARVADALAATQPLPDADLARINQAQKLIDGTQLVIPRIGEAVAAEPQLASGSATTPDGKISLNNSDAKALEQLPGVGPKTAEAIVAYRESIGGFTAVEQLKEVKGIGPAKFEKMKDQAVL
ncbi:helix-hairpin-helix domain-containing protein [Staphylococcus chromogenes]|nr:helix-hairpin-helix domain-containing protein [Staphylococcus chromogenes]